MHFKEHVEKTFQINPEPTPLFKMLLSALTITTPLIVGYFIGHLFVSMFASLMGLVFYLNDHFGTFSVRLKHLSVTFILLMASMVLGAQVIGNNFATISILFILSFLVGKSKNFGIELERMMLFTTLQFLTCSSDAIFKIQLSPLLLFSTASFFNYIFWAGLVYVVAKHNISPMVSKRETVKMIMTHNKSHTFPLVCAAFSCIGFMIAQFFKFSHANWIVGTTLIVVLPDSYQSIYKSSQRLIGTIIGVLIAVGVLTFIHDSLLLIAFVFLFSLLMPQGLSKNYWVANIYIAALILLFLEIAAPQSIASAHLAFWRIIDIAIGSFIGIVAAIWLKPEIIKNLTKSHQ